MDFNEYLADIAADGLDTYAPIPRRRSRARHDEFYYPDEDEPQPNEDDDDSPTT